MDKSKLDVAQLQKRDPIAWSALLHNVLQSDDVVVTAVSAVPLQATANADHNQHVHRYFLKLADHSDPITFICKRTNKIESLIYQNIAPLIPSLVPNCLFASLSDEEGWIVMEEVPSHFPPEKWTLSQVDEAIDSLSNLHATFWNQAEQLQREGIPHFIGEEKYTWKELKEENEIFFEEGPAAVISEHAINNAGRLAPLFLEAANGLAVIRDLGGWPGVLGESQLTAAADLLDDPVPMLQPLADLPATLLHGNPYTYHWRLNLFEDTRLVDWQNVIVGPGVWDLVNFIEQFDLLFDSTPWGVYVRQDWPTSEETIVDSYLLSMSHKVDYGFSARDARLAIPAARCLYILTKWFPYFAKWFSDMPNKYTWQKVNRLSEEQLAETVYQPVTALRPYLSSTFKRFLQAYRTL